MEHSQSAAVDAVPLEVPPIPSVLPEATVPEAPPPAASVEPWSFLKRLLFRFVFAYFVLYNLPFPLTYAPFVPMYYQKIWQGIVPWVGQAVFGLKITILPNGSGDTTWNYVQAFCFLVLAVVITLVWTLLDRKRPHYARLHMILRVMLRFVVAIAMISYGLAKVFDGQFLAPGPSRLVSTYGDSSPMGLLWTFMGASKAYCIFTGMAEVLGGLLLTMRRTALLGALITIGVMSNVVMLNFCYDVPVKLYSTHLLLMAVVLVLPHTSRLLNVFVMNRTSPPAAGERLFRLPEVDLTMAIIRSLVIALYTLVIAFNIWVAALQGGYGSGAPRSPLHGAWETQNFTMDEKVRPPLLTDGGRWRRLLMERQNMLVIHTMTNRHDYWSFQYDEKTGTLTLTRPRPGKEEKPTVLTATRPATDRLILEGEFNQHKIRAELKLVPESQYMLLSRGFHWVNEYPFQR